MPDSDNEALAVVSPDLQPVLEVFDLIPAVDEDPTPRMMRAIIEAPDPAAWEEVFTAAHFKDNTGKQVRISAIRRAPSRFKTKLRNQYLVADATFLDTGEQTVLTVGSEMAMAQLLACHLNGWLPADFEIVRKKDPTAAGFHPMRLSFLGKPVKQVTEQAG